MPRTNVDRVATEYRRCNDWIRGERKAQKIKQGEMADYLGISQSQYSKRENGVVEWTLKEWIKALEYLDKELKDIL